mmetsp:Transcript_70002/g.133447  ORF Transcript_70002/g.133447 Transcript_70002/m.133447 type:complete len:225 (+) Transcript_70002:417-1091(+)
MRAERLTVPKDRRRPAATQLPHLRELAGSSQLLRLKDQQDSRMSSTVTLQKKSRRSRNICHVSKLELIVHVRLELRHVPVKEWSGRDNQQNGAGHGSVTEVQKCSDVQSSKKRLKKATLRRIRIQLQTIVQVGDREWLKNDQIWPGLETVSIQKIVMQRMQSLVFVGHPCSQTEMHTVQLTVSRKLAIQMTLSKSKPWSHARPLMMKRIMLLLLLEMFHTRRCN